MDREDLEIRVPDGFEPVLVHQGEGPGVPMPGRIRHVDTGLTFWVGDGDVPKPPLRAHGEVVHKGWDIPTRWAIDADGACWMDNAHGHPLQRVCALGLLRSCEDQATRNHIRKHLGMKPEEPEWTQSARVSGWIPPVGVPDMLLKRVAEVETELVRLKEENEIHKSNEIEILRLAPKYGIECVCKIRSILKARGDSFRTRLDELESRVNLLRRKLRSKEAEIETLRVELNNARK